MPDLAPLGPGRFSNAQLLAIWSQTWPQWNCWRFSQSQLVLWREDPRIWNWGRYHPSKSGPLGGKPPDMELRELASSHRGFSLPLNSIGSGGSVLQLVLWDLLYCLGIIADYSSVGPEGTSWPLPKHLYCLIQTTKLSELLEGPNMTSSLSSFVQTKILLLCNCPTNYDPILLHCHCPH